MLQRAAPLFLVLAACALAPEERSPPLPASAPAPAPAAASAPSFSREAFVAPPGDAGAAGPPVPTVADPAALDEILAAAARAVAGLAPAATDRGAALGTDTGVTDHDVSSHPPHPPSPGPIEGRTPGDAPHGAKITVGKVTQEPSMSSPSIERALRAQIYWPLVQRCRDRRGAILPAEVVRLDFHIDLDGYVIPATVLAVPTEAQYEDAARCMARELTMATFRAPAAARGVAQAVRADVPSVD